MLDGGLGSWSEAGHPVQALPPPAPASAAGWKETRIEDLLRDPAPSAQSAESIFLPRIAGQSFLEGRKLPLRREMVSLFVDMVGSTRLVFDKPPEAVLEIMQAFMEIVIDVAAYHCGDVHDFEGDGALVYFEGLGEALPAAFRLRDELLQRRREMPELPLPRLSMDSGPIVIGIVGTRFRRTVSLVGPSLHVAARILKLAPPGGIAATETVLEHARRTHPDLAAHFVPLEARKAGLEPEIESARLWVAPAGETGQAGQGRRV